MVNLARMSEMYRVFRQKGDRRLLGSICGEIFSKEQERSNWGERIANIISNTKRG